MALMPKTTSANVDRGVDFSGKYCRFISFQKYRKFQVCRLFKLKFFITLRILDTSTYLETSMLSKASFAIVTLGH